MGIPRWRYVQYDDDGVNLYHCLNCNGKWTSRADPGQLDWWIEPNDPSEDTKIREVPLYHAYWNFCPFCACAWEGKVEGVLHQRNERSLGTRRFKQWLVVDALSHDRRYPLIKRLTWIIQSKWTEAVFDEKPDWQDYEVLFSVNVHEAYKSLKWHRENNNSTYRKWRLVCRYE